MSADAAPDGGAAEPVEGAPLNEAAKPVEGAPAGDSDAPAESAEPSEREPSASPAPRKRKKSATAKSAPRTKVPTSPEREGVPAFAKGFPVDAELDALLAAFDVGDYARVRREAPRLAKRTDRDDVRRAARELARRIDPDPIAVYLLLAAVGLLAFLAYWYWSHPHVP